MKEVISVIATALTFVAYIPYYRDILKGKTRPHIYSWSLWGLLTVLIVALQIKGGAGPAPAFESPRNVSQTFLHPTAKRKPPEGGSFCLWRCGKSNPGAMDERASFYGA